MIINHAPNSQNPTGGPEEGDGASAEAAPGRPAQLMTENTLFVQNNYELLPFISQNGRSF